MLNKVIGSFEVFVENLDFELLLTQWSQVFWFPFYIFYVPFRFEVLSLLVCSWESRSFTACSAFYSFFLFYLLFLSLLFLMFLLFFLFFLLLFIFEIFNEF